MSSPPYSHRNSQSFTPNMPPAPPPKPQNGETSSSSRRSTPAGNGPPLPPPPPDTTTGSYIGDPRSQQDRAAYAQQIPDPGAQWLPKILEDKSCVTLPPVFGLDSILIYWNVIGSKTSQMHWQTLIFWLRWRIQLPQHIPR